MMTEKQRVRRLSRYVGLARYEVDRFLSRACCHTHALAVWRNWKPIEQLLLPALDSGQVAPGSVDIAALMELTVNVAALADAVDADDDKTMVNGYALDEIIERVGGDMNKVMHEFVRVPMLAPGARGGAGKKKTNNNEPAVNVWIAAKGEQ